MFALSRTMRLEDMGWSKTGLMYKQLIEAL